VKKSRTAPTAASRSPNAYGRLQFGEDLDLHFRTIIGTGANPNVAAVIDMTLRTCNGRLTAAEALKHREFVMTKLYRSA